MAKYELEKDFEQENEVLEEKDTELVSYIKKRQGAMDTKRGNESKKRDIWDVNVKSPIYDGENGKAQVNMPIEQSLIEMRIGLIPDILSYRIAPNGKLDIDILEPAKYVLDFFVEKENVIKELRKRDYDKAKYGTGILYSGVWFETKLLNEATGEGGYYNTEYKATKKNIRHIGIKNVPIKNFWVDETALTIEEAMDCIYMEEMSVEELRTRYLNEQGKSIKGFKFVKSVGTDTAEMAGYKSDDEVTARRCVLWHYYNKLNGRYCIIANQKYPIYVGKMTTKHGELPFSVAQEYQRTDCFYGIGIPEKCKSTKPYINNFFKAALDRTWKGSAIMTVGVEADGDLWDDPSITAQWNFTGQGNVIPYEPNRDITPNIRMIEQMELWNTKNTGISVDPNFVLQAKTAFQTGVFKEEQNARLKPNNDDRNIALDRALTIMLANVSQFAPYLYADAILDKKTDEVEDYNWLEIRVKNKKIEKKEGKLEFKDEPGVWDFFKLDDKLLISGWMCKVRIETPSTTTNLKALEKAELNELLTVLVSVAQINPDALKKFPIEETIDRIELLYGFDMENLTARTQEKMNRMKIADLRAGTAKLGSGQSLSPEDIQNADLQKELSETTPGASAPMGEALGLTMGGGEPKAQVPRQMGGAAGAASQFAGGGGASF